MTHTSLLCRCCLGLALNLPLEKHLATIGVLNSQFVDISNSYLPTLSVFPGVSKFFIKSPGLSVCLLGDFLRVFLDIVFNDILTMQRFLDVSRFLYSVLAGMQIVYPT